MNQPDVTNRPIFILGMLQRTGTNHLWDLLGLHPDTELLRPVFEDQLVRFSPQLFSFVDDVSSRWTDTWEVPAEESVALLQSLGEGIVWWLQGHAPAQRVVTKMPSVEQVDRFFELFPTCPLVLLVRDGRSVSESGVNSFGWSYERAFRRWSRAADNVLRLLATHGDDCRLELVRYEELIDRPADVMRRICVSVGLDPETYPYELIDELPVRGSSTLRAERGSELHWVPVERTDTFDPRERWRTWGAHLHRRFAEVAGPQQLALGYELEPVTGSSSIRERLGDVRDLVVDARYRELRTRAGRLRTSVRRTPRAI